MVPTPMPNMFPLLKFVFLHPIFVLSPPLKRFYTVLLSPLPPAVNPLAPSNTPTSIHHHINDIYFQQLTIAI